jgi:predicted small metal-binding protein
MTKEISCINAGFEDCPFLIRSEDPDEVVEVAMRHAERAHGVETTREHAERIMVDV